MYKTLIIGLFALFVLGGKVEINPEKVESNSQNVCRTDSCYRSYHGRCGGAKM